MTVDRQIATCKLYNQIGLHMAAERQPVAKSAPITLSERYLETLSARSFLSLWSYPRIFRDQHNGKEICDLLVVFSDNVIIFSDKHCSYKDTGRPSIDWTRWYGKAIADSARQIWGAERWIKQNPQRLFLDQRCQKVFPLVIGPRGSIPPDHGSPRCGSVRKGFWQNWTTD